MSLEDEVFSTPDKFAFSEVWNLEKEVEQALEEVRSLAKNGFRCSILRQSWDMDSSLSSSYDTELLS